MNSIPRHHTSWMIYFSLQLKNKKLFLRNDSEMSRLSGLIKCEIALVILLTIPGVFMAYLGCLGWYPYCVLCTKEYSPVTNITLLDSSCSYPGQDYPCWRPRLHYSVYGCQSEPEQNYSAFGQDYDNYLESVRRKFLGKYEWVLLSRIDSSCKVGEDVWGLFGWLLMGMGIALVPMFLLMNRSFSR